MRLVQFVKGLEIRPRGWLANILSLADDRAVWLRDPERSEKPRGCPKRSQVERLCRLLTASQRASDAVARAHLHRPA